MIYQRVRGRIGGRVMSGLNGQHSGRAGMLSGVAAAIAGMTLNWASSPGNLLPPGFSLTRAGDGTYWDSAGLLQTAATDVARGTYRYNGSAWVFDGTINEAAATNTCLQSEDLTTTWSVGAGVSVTANAYTAPDGTATMDRINASAGNTQHYLNILAGVSISAGTTTYSFFLHYDNHRWVSVGFNEGTNVPFASFDLLNGVVGATGYVVGTGTISSRITPVGGNTYRCELTSTSAAGAASTLYISMNTSDSASIQTWNAAGTEKVGAWGGQVETGGTATSYIKTTTAAQTRNADVLTAPTSGLLVNGQGFAAMKFRTIAEGTVGSGFMFSTYAGGAQATPLYYTAGNVTISDGTVGGLATGTPVPTVGNVISVASTWSGSTGYRIGVNGAVGSVGSGGSGMTLGANLRIGTSYTADLFPVSMVLQSLRLGVQTVNNSRLANPFA